jgi:putative transposase
MNKTNYSSNLTDGEWNHIKGLIPKPRPGGRPRTLNMREVLNAIFYLIRGGIPWEMLPSDFPNWKSVYHYFRLWRITGIWKAIHDRVRAKVRHQAGRRPTPSAAILDSQSVKTTEVGGRERGYDAGKRVNGRKRHLLVDTMGLVLVAVVHAASTQDPTGARFVLTELAHRFTRLVRIWADGRYGGELIEWVWQLRSYRRIHLEIVKRQAEHRGFVVLPKRWIVERTFGWLGRFRRLSKDYERLTDTSETMIYVAMTRLMLRRLAAD